MKANQERQYARVIDYQSTFNSHVGRKVLYDLMRASFYLTPTLDGRHPDAVAMAFNEGQRAVVLRILQILKMNPNKLLELIKEGERENGGEFYDGSPS